MSRESMQARLGAAFGLDDPPTLTCTTPAGAELSVTELRADGHGDGASHAFDDDDAFLVMLHLRQGLRHESWQAVRSSGAHSLDQSSAHSSVHLHLHTHHHRQGSTSIHDLRPGRTVAIGSPAHQLAFYVPIATLAEVADDDEADGAGLDLHVDPAVSIGDPVIASLGHSLLPMLREPNRVNQTFVDHILLAFTSHLVMTYGRRAPAGASAIASTEVVRKSRPGSGLAPWQQRKAKALLDQHVTHGIAAEDLARACGLSPSAFLRAFKKSTGVPPHQWLLMRRVDHAKELMRGDPLPLSQIALSAGFADQSHFTRVFAQKVGVSPGAWRRAHGARTS